QGAGTAIGCTPRASARAQLRLDRLHHSAGHHQIWRKVEDAIIDIDVFLAGEARHLTEKKSLTCGFCHPEERDAGGSRPWLI
ncbi:hypothetical protein, partial [Streptomyces sp. NPDC093109]|uniref:hypothetical protein n=1 Tax=Streptomyces sp. NPDC093109 TaxID=3154977 RepID=UPI00344F0EBC